MTARSFKGATSQAEEREIPQVDDGTYRAVIVKVDEGDFPDGGNPAVKVPKYVVEWQLFEASENEDEEVKLAQFIRIPDGLLNDGFLSEKSNLYGFLRAIGIEVDSESYDIDPPSWLTKWAQVLVENKQIQSGQHAGEWRPFITKVLPAAKRGRAPQQEAPAPAPAAPAVAAAPKAGSKSTKAKELAAQMNAPAEPPATLAERLEQEQANESPWYAQLAEQVKAWELPLSVLADVCGVTPATPKALKAWAAKLPEGTSPFAEACLIIRKKHTQPAAAPAPAEEDDDDLPFE